MPLDPRLVALVTSLGGLLLWTLPWPWLLAPCAFALLFALVIIVRLPPRPGLPARSALQPGLLAAMAFIALWVGFKLLADALFALLPLPDSLAEAGLLALRLFGTLALGLAASRAATPLGLGLCAACILRPVTLRAWQVALALMIMLTLLPRCLAVLRETRVTLRARCQHLPFRQRLALFGAAALQRLDRETHARAVALVLRRLDQPEPWLWPPAPPRTPANGTPHV